MAVSINASAALNDGGSSTPPTLTNGLAFCVQCALDDDSRTISLMDLGTTNFVEPETGYSDPLANDFGANALHSHAGHILDTNIPSGSQTFALDFSQAMNQEGEGWIFYFEGVDQTTPVDDLSAHTGGAETSFAPGVATGPATMDLDVVDGDYVVFIVVAGNADYTLGGDWGGTLHRNDFATSGGLSLWIGSEAITADDANFQITWTKTAGNGGGVAQAFVIKGIVASGTTPKGPFGLPLHGPFAGPFG